MLWLVSKHKWCANIYYWELIWLSKETHHYTFCLDIFPGYFASRPPVSWYYLVYLAGVFPGQPKVQVKSMWQQQVFPHDNNQDTLHYLVSSADPKSTVLFSVVSSQDNLKCKLVWQQQVFPHDNTQDTLHYLVSSADPKSTELLSALGWCFPRTT